jgi:hypothetical protein
LFFDSASHVVDAALEQRDAAYQSIAIGVERSYLGSQKLRFGLQLGNTWRHSRNRRGLVRREDAPQPFAGGFCLAGNCKGRQSNTCYATPTTQP